MKVKFLFFFLYITIVLDSIYGTTYSTQWMNRKNIVMLYMSSKTSSTDSIAYYKKQAVAELRAFEKLSGASRLVSKIFADNLKHAKQYLTRAEKISKADDVELIFLKGVLQRLDGRLKEAEQSFKKIVSIDDRYAAYDFSNVWLQLGSTYREMNEFDLAIDAYKQGALINLNDTWPLIQLSIIFIELNKPQEASEAFYGGLNEINDPQNVDRLFIDVRDIASQAEIKQWESLENNQSKLEFLRIFWKKRDPNPIDPVNERLVEHYKRLSYARMNYSKPFKPWYDDRGTLFVRLNKPDRIYYGRPRQSIKENESWLYDNIKSGLFYDLVDVGGYFEIRSLFDAVEKDARIEDVVELFNERAAYNPYYQRLAVKIKTEADVQQLRYEEKAGMGTPGGTSKPDETALVMDASRTRFAAGMLGTNTFLQDNLFNLGYSGSQHFIFDVGAPHLPINCNFASFKAAKTNTRLEFYYAVPFNQLNFIPNISETNKFTTSLKLSMTLFDLKYDEVKKLDREFDITASGNEISSHFYIDQMDNEIPPGKYVAALEIRNNEKDKVGIYQFVISVRDYSADSLTVSDIEIAQYVDNTISKEKFVKPKSTLKVVPNPAAGILKTKPLTVYYEVYNLTLNDEGKSSYQISYSIKMAENSDFLGKIKGVFSGKKEASTSSITTKEGKSTTEREYIGFDISELPPGVATLEIKVKDLLSSRESSSTINLTIQDEEKKKTDETEKKP